MSEKISIVEVGPRDGLQNSKEILSFEQKKAFIQFLLDKGFSDVEAGAFVRADKIPAMSDSDKLATHFSNQAQNLWYLVPNLKGLQTALSSRPRQLAFFTATSATFNQKNIGMTVAESIDGIKKCIQHLKDEGFSFIKNWNDKPTGEKELKLRLYISTVIGCPYEGVMNPKATLDIIEQTQHMGFAQYSLGDTIGVGVPKNWRSLLKQVDSSLIKKNKIALHCHDTYGTALLCVGESLNNGVTTFDASMGGLGGCPYANGATGNLATEDLLYFLKKEGLNTGIKLNDVLDCFENARTGNLVNVSRVAKALKASC